MGNFTITVKAVGGHGQDRLKKDGEVVDFTEGRGEASNSPDAIAKRFVEELKAKGTSVESATITHWPGQPSEVTDDLLTGIRHGNF